MFSLESSMHKRLYANYFPVVELCKIRNFNHFSVPISHDLKIFLQIVFKAKSKYARALKVM